MQYSPNSIQSCLLNIYLFAPFIFGLLISSFAFLKNPVYIRRIANFISVIFLIFSFVMFTCENDVKSSIFNIDFEFDRISAVFSFISTFIFFLISIFSKTFIHKLHRAYRASLLIIYGLVNAIIMSDNILFIYACVIWLLFMLHFLFISYSKEEKVKKHIYYQLIFDVAVIFISLFLVGYDLCRYFVLNEIPFNYSAVSDNLYHINPLSAIIGFCGLFIVILKLFNFFPFTGKTISYGNKINPLIQNISSSASIIAGSILTIKLYSVFAYLFYDFQEIISLYLIINLIYFVILSFRQDSLVKFISSQLPAFISISLFNLLIFKESGAVIYLYSMIANIITYCFAGFVFNVIVQKLKTDNPDELKKISNKNKILKLFVITSLLNAAGIPLFCIFSSRFLTFANLFSVDFETEFMSIVPIFIILGCFALALNTLNIFYKILVAPVEASGSEDYLCKNQVVVLTLLLFTAIITGLFARDICALFTGIFVIGSI